MVLLQRDTPTIPEMCSQQGPLSQIIMMKVQTLGSRAIYTVVLCATYQCLLARIAVWEAENIPTYCKTDFL